MRQLTLQSRRSGRQVSGKPLGVAGRPGARALVLRARAGGNVLGAALGEPRREAMQLLPLRDR